jgi:hypothetical protein
MAAPTGVQLTVGLRRATIFELDANGYPAATGTSPYEGLEIIGPKAFTLTAPDMRKISHVGADRVLATDFLPPTEGVTGELRVAAHDTPVRAALTGVADSVVGESRLMPWVTDEQGNEPVVGALCFQQALDASTKLRQYRFYIIPRTKAIPQPSSMDENAAEVRFQLDPNPSTVHLWGTALTVGSEGVLEAAFHEGMCAGRPNIVAWKANGSEDEFLFPVSKPALSAGVVEVWDNGVLKTTGITVTTTKVTFDSPPTSTHIIVAFYEY